MFGELSEIISEIIIHLRTLNQPVKLLSQSAEDPENVIKLRNPIEN